MGRQPSRFLFISILAALAVVAAGPAAAQCGGLCLYEVGSFDMGTSAAGAGARAQDPGTALFNPAGMTRLDDTQVHIGMVNLIGNLRFNPGSGTAPNPPGLPPFAGSDDGGNIGTYLPLAGAFVSHELTDRFRVGMAFAGLYGGSADYDNAWVGRTLVTDSSLTALVIQPSLAFRITDWLSIGGGVGAVYTTFDLSFVTGLAPGAPTVEIKDADDWGVQGSIGLLFEPTEDTRVGLYWRSETALTLKGKFDVPAPVSLNYSGELNFPQGVNLSVFHQLTERIALLGDVGWSDWSQFGYMPASVGPLTLPIDREWVDTWRIGAGVQVQALDSLLLMTGFSYDSSPIKNNQLLPDIPVSENFRFSAGAKMKVADNIDLGATYTFLWLGDLRADNVPLPPSGTTTFDGHYGPNHMHIIGIQLQFRFGGSRS